MNKRLLLQIIFTSLAFTAGFQVAEEGQSLFGALILPFIIILVLVLLNGLFVAAEFAIISVRPSRLEQIASEKNGIAAKVLQVIESPLMQDRYIATAQLGITLASLGLGMYGEPKIAEYIVPYLERIPGLPIDEAVAHTIAFILSLAFLSYLHVVIGEMVPKSLALTSSMETALALVTPMRFAQSVLSVPVRVLNQIGYGLLDLFRIPPAEGHARLHSPEELELIVTESTEGGMLNLEEREIILNIFEFSERQVGQVMTPRRKIKAIPTTMPLEEVRRFVAESAHSRFPVYGEDLDHILGVLHVKDLVRAELTGADGAIEIRALLRPAPAVPEVQSVERLLAAFKRQRLHMAVVLDEFGGVAGIVTLEDLVEEIVGEVRDEFDVEREPFVEVEPGVLEVAGDYLVDDLENKIYLGEEDDLPDVETVGGLIISWLGRPPQVGDTYIHHDQIRFTVLDVDGLAVARARVEYPVPTDKGTEGVGSGE